MLRALVAGDSFMKPAILSKAIYRALREIDPEARVEAIKWQFKGYQKQRAVGVKREIREFAGDPHEFVKLVNDIDILVVHHAPVTEELLERNRKLRVIGCARGDPSNVDVDAATERGIPVINAPGRNAEAVADYTIGLILSLTRNIAQAHSLLKLGTWSYDFYDYERCGSELRGRTLGLIGFGQAGSEVAKRARAFDMKIVAYDPYVSPERTTSAGAESVHLETLLRRSDFISIHARLSPDTKHMISESQLRMMKRTAVIVNTARGPIIDEAALLKALLDGSIAGAALDVFENEPLTADHPLLKLDNVIATPHIAGASKENVSKASRMLSEDIKRVMKGKAPRFCVNPEVFSKRQSGTQRNQIA
jgi:D-3-phosphoglycerate dehydrogenase